MRLSVIIPAHNHLEEVLTALNSLQAMQSTRVEYLIQDDCSPEIYYPACIPHGIASVQRNERNLGFGGNCNTAAQRASGDILLFFNQDAYAVYGWSEGWDTALINAFAPPDVGIVGARLLFPSGEIQSAGGLIDMRGTPYHRCLGYSNPHYPEVATAQEVTWVTGAALAIRRSLFMELGGFDPIYAPSYFEDSDICLRAREQGYKVWYEPSVTFIHKVGTSGGSPHFTRSALAFKARWVDSGRIKTDTPIQTVRYW